MQSWNAISETGHRHVGTRFPRLGHLLVLLALAGCRAERPEMWDEHKLPAPNLSWSQATVAAEPELAANATLTFDRAAEIALAHHPDIARADAQVDAANARVGQALAGYFPQLRLTTSLSRATGNPSAADGDNNHGSLGWSDTDGSVRGGLGLTQLVFDFGKTAAAKRQAEHQLAATAADAAAVGLDTLLEARDAYLTLLADNALTDVAAQTVQNFENHLTETETQVRVGRRTEADVAKSRVDVGEAKLELLRARNAAAIARLTLNRVMSLEEDPGYQLQDTPPALGFEVAEADAVAQARLSRTEIAAARERFEVARAQLQRAWLQYFPTISFSASFDAAGDQFPLAQNWSLGPTLDWNVLNGGRVIKEVEEAEASWRAARAELAATEQRIYFAVRQALLDHGESLERAEVARETVASSQESLRLISGRYQVGRATLLEQTDAELAFSRARAEEIRARYDAERSAARLLRAMGLAVAEKQP